MADRDIEREVDRMEEHRYLPCGCDVNPKGYKCPEHRR